MPDTTNRIDDSKEIILGSGDLYQMEFDGETIPEYTEIEVDANRAGNIKGGCKVEYSTSSNTVKSDNGRVSKTILTEETVKMTTGMITWTDNWLEAAMRTARKITEGVAEGHTRFHIGGLDNVSTKNWLFHFLHKRDDGGKVRLTMTGKSTGPVSIDLNTENPTTVDAEITAEPVKGDGTLLILDVERPTTITS